MRGKMKRYCLIIVCILVAGIFSTYVYSKAYSEIKTMRLKDENGVETVRDGILLSKETEMTPGGYIYSEELYEILP